ncbi:MAG: HpsJ family protein [Sphaerospermopsis kisseleviana]
MVNRVSSFNSSLILKVVGIVCILSFFVDFVILLLGFSLTDKQVQIGFTTALVDRGIVPLVGLGIISAAYWLDNLETGGDRSGLDLRLPSMILASILGLMFLLIFPFHLNNVRQASTQRVNQISQEAQQLENQTNQEAQQAETRLNSQLSEFQSQLNNDQAKAQLEQARSQVKAQLTQILKDEQRYKQALENPQLPPEQKELLKKFKANPQELDKFLAQQTDPNQLAQQTTSEIRQRKEQKITEIRQRKEEAQKQAKNTAWMSGLRIGISSLILAIGYTIIGWTGLKGLKEIGALQNRKPKAPLG